MLQNHYNYVLYSHYTHKGYYLYSQTQFYERLNWQHFSSYTSCKKGKPFNLSVKPFHLKINWEDLIFLAQGSTQTDEILPFWPYWKPHMWQLIADSWLVDNWAKTAWRSLIGWPLTVSQSESCCVWSALNIRPSLQGLRWVLRIKDNSYVLH